MTPFNSEFTYFQNKTTEKISPTIWLSLQDNRHIINFEGKSKIE